jgi:hypothetical protein
MKKSCTILLFEGAKKECLHLLVKNLRFTENLLPLQPRLKTTVVH